MIKPDPNSAISVFAAMKKLSKAQREAVMRAHYYEYRHAYMPAGYYLDADRRVLRKLTEAGIVRDYLNSHQRLTEFGLAVHRCLTELSL